MELLENLNWRYATKKYDPLQKVSEENIDKIKEAIRLSATSYGLQLFKVLDIQKKDLRTELQPASWGQSQVVDASHLFVFCTYTDIEDEYIDDFLRLKSETQKLEIEALKGYGDFVKNKMSNISLEAKQNWMAKQAYIGLSSALMACAELKIDSTPMEGFEVEEYNKILKLEEKGLKAAVVLAIGYRSDEDQSQHQSKVRKPKDHIFETIGG